MFFMGTTGGVSLVACSDDTAAGDTTAADVADGSVGADIQSPDAQTPDTQAPDAQIQDTAAPDDGLAQGDLVESDDAGAPDVIATPDGGGDSMDGLDGAGDAIVEPVDDPVYQYALAVAQVYADQLEFVAQCCCAGPP